MRRQCCVFGLLALPLLDGCVSTTSVDASDRHVFFPSVRSSLNLTKEKESPSEFQNGQAIEFGFTQARGSGSQSLDAGKAPVIFADTLFSTPTDLKNDFVFSFTDVSFRWRKFVSDKEPLGVEVRAGVGYAALDLSVSSPTQHASEHSSAAGALGGVGLFVRLRPSTSVLARWTGFLSPAEGPNRAIEREIYLVQTLHKNVAVTLGYTDWTVKGETLFTSADFKLRFSGPALGLELNFGM